MNEKQKAFEWAAYALSTRNRNPGSRLWRVRAKQALQRLEKCFTEIRIMLYCEDCRVKKNWNLPATREYCEHGPGKCEVCKRHKQCYSYPALYVKPKSEWTQEEIMLDKVIQHEYHQKAEGMVLAYSSGQLDHKRGEVMKDAVIRDKERNDQIDWFATYKLRQRIQEGYRKVDELNRDRR